MSWFETLGSEVRYDGVMVTVRVDTIRTPDGEETSREVADPGDAVAMVPILDDGSVLLLRQYRHPIGASVLEIPAGKLDEPGEAVEEAARRELREEVEHLPGRLTHLVTFLNSAGWSTERTHVYLATELEHVGAPDDFEADAEEAAMEIVRLPFTAALEQARSGDVQDAKTVIGLLLAAPHVLDA